MDYCKQYKALYWESEEIFNNIMESSGLSSSEYMTMLCISDGIDTQKEICKGLYLPKQTVHSAIKKLVARGYVVVSETKSANKTKQIIMTEAGRAAYDRLVSPTARIDNEAFAELAQDEQKELVRIVTKYNYFLRLKADEYLSCKKQNER